MDIWAWFRDYRRSLADSGDRRLAYDLRILPNLVVNNRHAQVDQLVPSLVAIARERQQPWVEVFVRHWSLQSRVLHRCEVDRQLPEAVALLDFANQPETRDCPQSICVVQDLAQCYTYTDGPGYVDERLRVSRETLDRIDPTWPCFECISGEYATALNDAGRYEEALDFCRVQMDQMPARERRSSFRVSRVRALMALGRYEEALAVNDDASNPAGGESWALKQRIDRAALLGRLGRLDEALATLPQVDVIVPTPSTYVHWVDAIEPLVSAGRVPNSAALDAELRRLAERLERQGVLRQAFDLYRYRADLAMDRQRPWVAANVLEAMRRVAARLERPLDAPSVIEAREARLAQIPTPPMELAESPAAQLEALTSQADVDYQLLQLAVQKWPDDEPLWLAWATAARNLGFFDEIVDSGRAFFARTNAPAAVTVVARALIDSGNLEHAHQWAQQAEATAQTPSQTVAALLANAAVARARGDEDAEIARLEAVLAIDPDHHPCRQALIARARASQAYETAQSHVDKLLESFPEQDDLHWTRLIVASINGDWAAVRASAAALDIPVEPGDGPIDEHWGLCRIKMTLANGEVRHRYAIRTGPVTARILEISDPREMEQHYGMRVVFDPEALNPPEEDEEEDEDRILIFPCEDAIEMSTHRAFAIDGARPDAETFKALKADLQTLGAVVQRRSKDGYRIEHASEDGYEGLYWYVAVPQDADLAPFVDRLEKAADELDGPMVWPELAEAAGRSSSLEAQRALIRAWDLM